MPLTPGWRLGPYEVLAKLGEGGMGEVYRARDTKLGRSVAMKVLPELVAADPERLTRFHREAQLLAALNHPHIAAIYGFEDSGETHALVMELVEGLTLADRIANGPLAVAEALSIAQQIAEALEAAHEQGIVHRDLKPANIKVRPDGTVKVLDFGLAKLNDANVASPSSSGALAVTMSPTMSIAATQAGLILGTAAYMAPEQASGKPVDKRADIWAFGVVLWEMLTGRQLFEGETISHVLAAVLTREPDLSAAPTRVRALLTRCLEKDPRKRLRDIGDAMALVPAVDVGQTGAETGTDGVARRRWIGAGGWAMAAGLTAVLAVTAWQWPATVADTAAPAIRFQIERPADVYNRTATAFAVSPDGLMLAFYGAGADGVPTLFIRTLVTGEVRELPGSSAAAPVRSSLFWSPDSRQLVRGTATGGQIFDLSAGTTRSLCACAYVGGTWGRDGTILLGAFGNSLAGISRVSTRDATPVAVTTVDASKREQDTWPVLLPDGRRFLFTRSAAGGEVATYLGSLDGMAPRRIADGSQRIFVPPSGQRGAYLLGIDASGLVAQPFDLKTMNVSGPHVALSSGAVAASASDNGVLATSAAGSRPRTIPTWFDRAGRAVGQVGEEGLIESVALSPDGRRLAVAESAGVGANSTSDVWLRDLVNGGRTRVTFDRGSTPVWSPDGSRLAFTSNRQGVNLPYQRSADGTGSETPLFPYDRHAWVNDWSRDGRWIIFSSPQTDATAGNDLWFVPVGTRDAKPTPYLRTPALEQQAQFSPDGRFVAYGSDQSGNWEIYVQPFPNAPEGKWMVSNGGGVEPRWSRDGKELFYFSGQTLMAVPVSLQPTFSTGPRVALFDAAVQPGYTADSHRWQVAPDGKRFLLLVASGNVRAAPLEVVVNWPSLVRK
jgi:Tol biopolymer transport system component